MANNHKRSFDETERCVRIQKDPVVLFVDLLNAQDGY
jgi:hypothetical protein